MAWCHQATSHYLSQCWPRSLLPYDGTRPQCVKWAMYHYSCHWTQTSFDNTVHQHQDCGVSRKLHRWAGGDDPEPGWLYHSSFQWKHSTGINLGIYSSFLTGLVFINTLRQRQNGSHFADDTFKRIFLYEIFFIKISLKFVRKGPVNNILALVQIMAWRRPGDKPLSAPMMVRLPTHICVTRPQRVKRTNRQSQL